MVSRVPLGRCHSSWYLTGHRPTTQTARCQADAHWTGKREEPCGQCFCLGPQAPPADGLRAPIRLREAADQHEGLLGIFLSSCHPYSSPGGITVLPLVRPHTREAEWSSTVPPRLCDMAGTRATTVTGCVDGHPGLLPLPLPSIPWLTQPTMAVSRASVPQLGLGTTDPGDGPASELACAGRCKAGRWPHVQPVSPGRHMAEGSVLLGDGRASEWPILCQGPGPDSI